MLYDIAFVDQFCDHYGAVFNWYIFKCWKKLDPYGSVPEWFKFSVVFFDGVSSSFTYSLVLSGIGFLNILEFSNFMSVCNYLSQNDTSSLLVYTDRSLSNLGTVSYKAGAVIFFEDIDLGLDVDVLGLMLSTLAKLQAIALALKCVSLLNSVQLFSDSQSALEACSKNLGNSWHKIKDHSGISENEHADVITGATSIFALHYQLPVVIQKHLYNRLYPSILCLYYGDVKMSDHVFSCKIDNSAQC
ncbi:hypothetical protein G9A89_000621 [Geosiphon pyriformis]|nr:hypothetical protein G9A89_000621 [Geosiphon pyriformis]